MKNIHLIIAHPNIESLNYALYHQAKDIVQRRQGVLCTSDLYSMLEENHPATVHYGLMQSDKENVLIKTEQQKIKEAQLTIIQFPLYWFAFPGLLKTYWERVLTPGFAYPGKFKESPLYDGRKLLLSITTQSMAQDFSPEGLNGEIEKILYPILTAFRFVGYHILKPFVAFGVHDQAQDQLVETLASHAQCIEQAILY